jgi:hypothetical protein
MLQATIEFRKSFDLSGIRTRWKETIEFENSTGKIYVRGFDKEGHVILYMKPRNENSKSHDGNLKHVVWNLEKAIACMEATTQQEKLVLIIDYDGFSMSSAPPMKTSKATLNILQDHYPERLFRAYVIRPLTLFYGFFKMISPFIDPVTKGKIVMLTNASKYSRCRNLDIFVTRILFSGFTYLDLLLRQCWLRKTTKCSKKSTDHL